MSPNWTGIYGTLESKFGPGANQHPYFADATSLVGKTHSSAVENELADSPRVSPLHDQVEVLKWKGFFCTLMVDPFYSDSLKTTNYNFGLVGRILCTTALNDTKLGSVRSHCF